MGVQGLWELLAPVGRRVSVETLAGKKLAIDASIWMVQFMKAMRDEKGEMIRNAHLLGFFRRICKLMFLRTKPVFVFDGGTPALKRRTVIARRRQRENAQAKVRKTAEKLLLNHLKALKLKELANNIKDQRLKQKSDIKGQQKSNQMHMVGGELGRSNVKALGEISGAKSTAVEDISLPQPMIARRCTQEELDEMLAASLAAKEVGMLADKGVLSANINLSEEEGDVDDEMILPVNSEIDPAVLAALPQSMQLDILAQYKGKIAEGLLKNVDSQKQPNLLDKGKGKGILFSEVDKVGGRSQSDVVSRTYNQDKVDEMLDASIAAEENEKLLNNASTSVGPFTSEDEDGNFDEDEDEEMIVPEMHGKVDPAVLASLPPSMQLDLLVQMRERLIAENRQKYQKVKKDPAKFSELQIQAYLKTVAFRREIDGVQKAAAGGGVDGVQTSRIASEAGREYIFSSSFTGDKRELTSTRLEKAKDTQQMTLGNRPLQNFMNSIAQANNSNASSEPVRDEPQGEFDDSIQTYLDERGRFRVSRLRAMGLRMTRDIQRNLDLMKEIEQEGTDADTAANMKAVLNAERSGASRSSSNQLTGMSCDINVDLVEDNMGYENPIIERDTSMEISFEDDGENKCLDADADLFASLVAGNSRTISFVDNTSKERPSNSSSDCDWEEGVIEDKNNLVSGDVRGEVRPSLLKDENSVESDVEWEEGDSGGSKNTLSCAAELAKAPSQGSMEDEANLQEAMRKSLESIGDGKHSGAKSALSLSESGKVPSRGCLEEEADLQEAIRRSLEGVGNRELKRALPLDDLDEHSTAHEVKLDCVLNQDGNLVCSGMNDVGVLNRKIRMSESNLLGQYGSELNESFKILEGDKMLDNLARNNLQTSHISGMQSKSFEAYNSSNMRMLINKSGKMEIGSHSGDLLVDENERMEDEVCMAGQQLLDTGDKDFKVFTLWNKSSKVDPLSAAEEEENNCNNIPKLPGNSYEITKPAPLTETCLDSFAEDLVTQPEYPREDNTGNCCEESKHNLGKEAERTSADFSADAAEFNLEKEMQILGQEYKRLENEQRKLERNAESVNSELFTECQGLLQMFGLPYIIAPMEAEAQCAYLELAGLVDGVVTDDSDVLLFGARNVYKNIFDDRKYVETYLMEDIEKELGLSREKLIRMALLLGSDYTEGVSGIGIVNAIEVVNAFPEDDGLLKFRLWVESPDPTILGRFDAKGGSSSRKRGSKAEDNIGCSNSNMEEPTSDQSISHGQEEKDSSDYIQETQQIFMDKHRNVSKNWHIPSSFPSEAVISAYSGPQVDKSTELFAWGKPDHLVLRKLCWEKFGWTTQRADELLLPVLKEYNKHETQLRLEAFYTFNERFAKIRSKRIKKAVKGITGNQPLELMEDFEDDLSKGSKFGRGSSVEPGDSKPEKGIVENLASKNNSKMEHLRKRKNAGDTVARKHSRRKRNSNGSSPDAVPSEVEKLELYMQAGEDKNNGKALSSNRSGGGRASVGGRGRGRSRGVGVKRGKKKETLGFESSETSANDDGNEDDEQRLDVPEVMHEMRRSTRSRKTVNYSMEDVENEDANDSFDQINETIFPEEAIEENLSHIRDTSGDAATVLNGEKDSDTVNPPPPEDLSRDYLELGAGFCADEGEATQPGTSNYDISFDDGPAKDYFKFGGGFCEDNSETGNNQSEIHGVTAATLEDNADLQHHTGFLVQDECKRDSVDQFNSDIERAGNELHDRGKACKDKHSPVKERSNYDPSAIGVMIPENALDNTENYRVALSAMPFLRKKRRKT